MSILRISAGLLSLAASVSAHGYVQGIVADGTYYSGYNPSFQYQSTPPSVPGWSDPEDLSNGYVAPDAFADPDIICHLDATPGTSSATVAAGGKVELQWTTWPESHHGPVLDYLAPVTAENWADVDKTSLSFFKIGEGGLVDGSSSPGAWASDQLIANNNSWVVNIPESVAAGKYVLRHEIIALHSAGQSDGAQNYPQCINLEITGSGSASPEGILGTALYKEDDPGILVNIYTTGYSYIIPGPTLWSGAASAASQTGVTGSHNAASSSAAASTTSAVTTTSLAAEQYSESASSSSLTSSTPSTTAVPGSKPTTESNSSTTANYITTTEAIQNTGAAPYSAIATLASAIPQDALTSTLPAYYAAPSATGLGGSQTNGTSTHWGDLPSKPLPAGWCLKDLLQWSAYLLKQNWANGGDQRRNHARDFQNESEKDLKMFESFADAML